MAWTPNAFWYQTYAIHFVGKANFNRPNSIVLMRHFVLLFRNHRFLPARLDRGGTDWFAQGIARVGLVLSAAVLVLVRVLVLIAARPRSRDR